MNPDKGLPKPDLVMFLQLSPSEAAQRGQFGTERYETTVFQKAVQQKFELLMKDSSVKWQVRNCVLILHTSYVCTFTLLIIDLTMVETPLQPITTPIQYFNLLMGVYTGRSGRIWRFGHWFVPP